MKIINSPVNPYAEDPPEGGGPSILAGLNPPQFQAVTTEAPATLVVAGAGSGKTSALTRRVAYLIKEQGVSASNILALTFTRKAAAEMRERITGLIGEQQARRIWIGTFHAVSLRMLEEYGSKIGYQRFISVYDEIDQEDIVRSIITELGLSVKPQDVLKALGRYGADCDGATFEAEAGLVVDEYRARLKQFNAVDYTLLLTETLRMLREHRDVWAAYHERFTHVFVDEYQDVDRTQYYLHEELKPAKIFVVGDHDQAIYKFRGSDVQIVLDFETNHAGAEVIKLEESYRCPAMVVQAANNLIRHNPNRIDKTLWTRNGPGLLEISRSATEEDEASVASSWAKRLIDGGTRPEEVAILTRTHGQHAPIVKALTEAGVPFKVVGASTEWWRHGVGRLMVTVLSYMHNRRDSWRFARFAKTALYGLSDADFLRMEIDAINAGRRLPEFMIEKLGGPIVELLAAYDENRDHSLLTEATTVVVALKVREMYERQGLASKVADVELMLRTHVPEWEAAVEGSGPRNVEAFLEWVADQDAQKEISDDDGTVKVATIHAVKGLEFDAVFVAGFSETFLPHKRSIKENDVEEERRLAYVGITRARSRLMLSVLLGREVRMRIVNLEESRFLGELSNHTYPLAVEEVSS